MVVCAEWMKIGWYVIRAGMYSHISATYAVPPPGWIWNSLIPSSVVSVLSHEKAPCQSTCAFRGKSRGRVTYSWLSRRYPSQVSACNLRCFTDQPFASFHASACSSCLKSKQPVASMLIIHGPWEKKVFMWGYEMLLASIGSPPPWN